MVDPICRMNVEPGRAAGSHIYNGQTYYFCSQHCLAKFKEDPEKFLKSQTHAVHEHAHAAAHPHAHDHEESHGHGTPQKPKSDETEHGIYVCPMDAEVRESKPGAC
ncbi:MAG TPA: YHS domain-containing protein, partial [Pyrinomonadaceae bacterium]